MKFMELYCAAISLAMATSIAAFPQNTPAPSPADAAAAAQQDARLAMWRQHPLPGHGPFAATRVEEKSLPTHTIYRPANMADVKAKLPIVSFGNGGCRNTSIEFTAFLAEIASHGYFVVAAGRNDVDFAGGGPSAVPSNGLPLQVMDPSLLNQGVDWAIAENARNGSPYQGKLDTNAIAYMGQSCGGLQALTASKDPRTKTTVVLNSGYFGAPPPGLPPMKLPERAAWAELHAPIAYFIGGPADIAYQNANQNFSEINALPVFKAELAVGHTGAYPAPDMRWTNAVVAWLDWQLKGNMQAGAMFVGTKCGICIDPNWSEVASKNLK